MPDETFRYSVTLIDERAMKSTLNFQMDVSEATSAENFTLAVGEGATISAALLAVSDALVYSENLTYLISGGSSLPADADITDEAAIVCFLSEAAEVPKYHVLRIPAPADAIFEADGVTVDESDSDLIAYVDALSESGSVVVSDGEQINVDLENGISHGFWRSVKKSSQ
jgi:hypothetical protein